MFCLSYNPDFLRPSFCSCFLHLSIAISSPEAHVFLGPKDRTSQIELVGFIFPTIVDKTIDKTMTVNYSREKATNKFGLGKPVVIWNWGILGPKKTCFRRSNSSPKYSGLVTGIAEVSPSSRPVAHGVSLLRQVCAGKQTVAW